MLPRCLKEDVRLAAGLLFFHDRLSRLRGLESEALPWQRILFMNLFRAVSAGVAGVIILLDRLNDHLEGRLDQDARITI